jgi:hypothetical protein
MDGIPLSDWRAAEYRLGGNLGRFSRVEFTLFHVTDYRLFRPDLNLGHRNAWIFLNRPAGWESMVADGKAVCDGVA